MMRRLWPKRVEGADMADHSEPEVATRGAAPAHRHRLLIGALFALGTVIGIVAVLAVWTNRQALNTDNWTQTSSKVLADEHVQTALSSYLVTELFKSADVQTALENRLPEQLQGLAAPAAAGLQQVAGQAAPKLLASSQVQDAWEQANRAAHTELMRSIEGGGDVVSTEEGAVTLDLHALVSQLAARLGIEDQVAAAQAKVQGSAGATARNTVQGKLGVTLPPSSGRLEILRSDQLKTAQDVAGAIKGLAIVLPLLTFALFILAVWLSPGRRRVALRTTGWCFVGIGLVTLIARRLIGNQVVDGLVQNPSNETAAHDVWTIATSLLYDIGAAVIVYGLILVVAAAVAGPTRPAIALRRALAPSLRDRPATVYGLAGLVYLLGIAWAPTPAFRQVIPLLGVAALLILGIEALRAKTAREFPDAQPGDTMAAVRSWDAARRQPPAPATTPQGGGRLGDLERLATLHDRGALTDAEYESEKTTLISTGTRGDAR
jgi:hypothetical protein